jgi:TRAP-type C4-dicarboxylate transport system permease small subunit
MKRRFIELAPIISGALLLAPTIASAQGILGAINVVNRILQAVVPLLITVALIVFIWGLIQYLFKIGTSEDNKQKGIQLMLWGVIAIFVMSSVWGLVALLQNTFSVQRNEAIVPRAPDISIYGR